ncbi:MAG: MFS transporter [Gammaproteobacteria bacterium]|nr:MFS transporter [Gammaproteobacteria bacterium]
MATEPAKAIGPLPPSEQQTPPTTASRYYVLALLVLINVLSYVDRHMLPAFAAQITVELDLSRQQFGLLTGFAFVAVYALSGPVMGVLADRFNPSRVIAWGIALWSAMTWLTGLSRNFLQILLPRMAVGIGEATLHPAAAGILGRLFAPSQRATVFGLFFMGSHIGLGLAYWLAGTLGEAIGWRMMFMTLGAAGLLLALVLVASARFKPKSFAPPVDPAGEGDSAAASAGTVVRALIASVRGNAAFRQAVLGISLLHAIYASGQFMQLWLVTEKGLPESTASSLYGSVYLLCAIPAAMLGGLAADWFARRFHTTHALFVALVGAATWPLVILFRVAVPESASFYLGMGATVFLLAFPYGAMISLVLNEAPRSIQSTAIAFTMFAANVLVIGTGTYAIGLFSDLLEAQQVAAPLTKALLGADLVVLVAIMLYFRLHRTIQSRQSNAEQPVSA